MSDKKSNAGRKSKDHLETLKITLTPIKGKAKCKTFRATTFDFDKVVDGVKLIIKNDK